MSWRPCGDATGTELDAADRPEQGARGAAAAALADEAGLEALSMRKLGQRLGVEAMSLYNHVANKDDLLDGMIDVVFSEIDLPASDAGWRTAMRQRAASVREALARHPWATGLMEPGQRTGRRVCATTRRCWTACAKRASRSRTPPTRTGSWTATSTGSRSRRRACCSTPEELVEMAEIVLLRVPAETYLRLNEAAAAPRPATTTHTSSSSVSTSSSTASSDS